MKNYNRPEGSIVENYIAEESVEFCSEYLSNVDAIGLPKNTSHESKALSTGMFCDTFFCVFNLFMRGPLLI